MTFSMLISVSKPAPRVFCAFSVVRLTFTPEAWSE